METIENQSEITIDGNYEQPSNGTEIIDNEEQMPTDSPKQRKEQTTKEIVGFSVLGLLFLLLFSYFELLGWMYMTKGEALKSLLLMGVPAIVISLSSFLLPRIWSSNSRFVCKRRSSLMWIDGSILGVALLFAFVGVNHFDRIFSQRQHIEELYSSGINEARKLYPTYDKYVEQRCSTYKNTLQRAVAGANADNATYQTLVGRFPGHSDDERIEILVSSLHRTLQPSNDNLQTTFNDWLDKAGEANIWNISFVSNVVLMDNNVTSCINELKKLSASFYHPGEEHQAFEYPQFESNDELQTILSNVGFYLSWRSLLALLLTTTALILPVTISGLRSTKDL